MRLVLASQRRSPDNLCWNSEEIWHFAFRGRHIYEYTRKILHFCLAVSLGIREALIMLVYGSPMSREVPIFSASGTLGIQQFYIIRTREPLTEFNL